MADRARLTRASAAPPIGTSTIALVRHAETTWVTEDRFQGRADTRLSPRGEAQAVALGQRLAHPSLAPALPLPAVAPIAVWHSPLERAAATARVIATAHQPPSRLVPEADLIELDVGDWEGLTNTEVGERWQAELTAWRSDPTIGLIPGGEPAADGSVRVKRALSAIVAELAEGAEHGAAWSIVVSHDGILRLALLGLLGLPLDRFWVFPMAAAGITVVDRLDRGPWRLRAHGLIADSARGDVPGT